MDEKLKPCPFCGNEDIMIIRDESVYEVLCQKCGIKSRAFLNREQAIRCWNTRATGWIKTSERLPESNKDVLMFLEDEKRIYIGFMDIFDEGHLYDYVEQCWGIAHKAEEIPYWMPLPEPPEVEKE